MPRFPQPGAVLLGKYRVDSLIGEGGMGAVIKARHIELDEFVAIKCLLPEMMERTEMTHVALLSSQPLRLLLANIPELPGAADAELALGAVVRHGQLAVATESVAAGDRTRG